MCAFLRCESPSAFLGTCISHHSFIILLITSTSALLTGLYLISTKATPLMRKLERFVSMPSRAYTSFLRRCSKKFIKNQISVNALSGLYLISTGHDGDYWSLKAGVACQCPLGLIPHFYCTPSKT